MYKLQYDDSTGKVSVIVKDTLTFIPLCAENTDFQDFLKWNSEQETPLDLNSTIEVVPPEPARDLAKEIDDLKSQLSDVQNNISTIAVATNTNISVRPIKGVN